MQTYTNNIELQPNHTYFHEELGNVKSVTSLIKGSNTNIETFNMEEGTKVHKILELFLKGLKEEAKELYNSLSSSYQHKVKTLVEALKEINIKDGNCELSFVTIDNTLKYGGTVDLLTKDIAIDFKSGELNNNHILQTATYSVANNKKQGLILSFKNNKLQKTVLNQQEIENGYKEFTNKAKHTLDIIDPYANELLNDLTVYHQIKASIEDLDKKLKEQKALIEAKLLKDGFNSYKVSNYSCFNQKGKESTTLTKEAKASLIKSNPEYFKTITTKPTFIIRGA